MINKSIIPNEEDGTNYEVSIVAGPFSKYIIMNKTSVFVYYFTLDN